MSVLRLMSVSVNWSDSTRADAANEVAAILAGSGLRATWLLVQPAASDTLLRLSRDGSEIGLAAPAGLLSTQRARSVVVEVLSQARRHALRHGLAIATIGADSQQARRNAELLAQYGVRCLTPIGDDSSQPRGLPDSLRYGLWRIPVTLRWPWLSRRNWLRGGPTLDRALQRAAAGGLLHARIDVDKLAVEGRAGRSRLARDLDQLRIAADRSRLTPATLAEAAEALSCPRARTTPARSILRAA